MFVLCYLKLKYFAWDALFLNYRTSLGDPSSPFLPLVYYLGRCSARNTKNGWYVGTYRGPACCVCVCVCVSCVFSFLMILGWEPRGRAFPMLTAFFLAMIAAWHVVRLDREL